MGPPFAVSPRAAGTCGRLSTLKRSAFFPRGNVFLPAFSQQPPVDDDRPFTRLCRGTHREGNQRGPGRPPGSRPLERAAGGRRAAHGGSPASRVQGHLSRTDYRGRSAVDRQAGGGLRAARRRPGPLRSGPPAQSSKAPTSAGMRCDSPSITSFIPTAGLAAEPSG